jgi:hypothetical protein
VNGRMHSSGAVLSSTDARLACSRTRVRPSLELLNDTTDELSLGSRLDPVIEWIRQADSGTYPGDLPDQRRESVVQHRQSATSTRSLDAHVHREYERPLVEG